MSSKQPSEIARDTLKLLAQRKLSPTPENFQALYLEIAGLPAPASPLASLRELARSFPAATMAQQRQLALLDKACLAGDLEQAHGALKTYIQTQAKGAARDEHEHAGSRAVSPTQEPASGPLAELALQIGKLVESAMPALGSDDSKLPAMADELLAKLKSKPTLSELKPALASFAHRLGFAAEDQAEIRSTLLSLLRQVFENLGELSLEDRWLSGQIQALMSASEPPLSLRRLDDLERRLKDLILKQSSLKAQTLEAQEQMKALLAAFLDRLGSMADQSSLYQRKIERVSEQLQSATSLPQIAPALAEAIEASRSMASDALRYRDELREMKRASEAQSEEIARLREELAKTSEASRHDFLTGALNRRGLEEAFAKEIARAARQGSSLCVALIDIDNFKQLNDRMGHATGDAALQHLASVARETLRPQDTLSRHGGEEFIVLLPDTSLEAGVLAIQRLQRELTKRIFLHEAERVLVTFSAGVSQALPGETPERCVERADQAMYLAKRAGKNRVVAA